MQSTFASTRYTAGHQPCYLSATCPARPADKLGALIYLVREVLPAKQLTILFTATRHHVEFLHGLLTREGIESVPVYGTMDQTARKIHLAKFRAKKVGRGVSAIPHRCSVTCMHYHHHTHACNLQLCSSHVRASKAAQFPLGCTCTFIKHAPPVLCFSCGSRVGTTLVTGVSDDHDGCSSTWH